MTEQKQTYTVLICGTDEALVTQIRQALEAVRWPIVGIAASENEAAELAKQHKPDIIIMALTLQAEQDGLAVTRRILKLQASAVVLLSADTSEEVVQAAIKAGVCGLLAIPLDAELIMPGLQQAKKVYDTIRKAFEDINNMEAARLSAAALVEMLDHAHDVLKKVKPGSTRPETRKKIEFVH